MKYIALYLLLSLGVFHANPAKTQQAQIIGTWVLSVSESTKQSEAQGIAPELIEHIKRQKEITWIFQKGGTLIWKEGGREQVQSYYITIDSNDEIALWTSEGSQGSFIRNKIVITDSSLTAIPLAKAIDGKENPMVGVLHFTRK